MMRFLDLTDVSFGYGISLDFRKDTLKRISRGSKTVDITARCFCKKLQGKRQILSILSRSKLLQVHSLSSLVGSFSMGTLVHTVSVPAHFEKALWIFMNHVITISQISEPTMIYDDLWWFMPFHGIFHTILCNFMWFHGTFSGALI